MALDTSNGGELVDFLCPSQTAFTDCSQKDTCDYFFDALVENVINCKYYNLNYKLPNCNTSKRFDLGACQY